MIVEVVQQNVETGLYMGKILINLDHVIAVVHDKGKVGGIMLKAFMIGNIAIHLVECRENWDALRGLCRDINERPGEPAEALPEPTA